MAHSDDQAAATPAALRLVHEVERWRAERDWTQKRLLQHIGIPPSTWSRLQTSPKKPLLATVSKVADAIGMPRDRAMQLAGILPMDAPLPDVPEGTSVEEIRAAIEASDELSAEQKRLILGALDLAVRSGPAQGWTSRSA